MHPQTLDPITTTTPRAAPALPALIPATLFAVLLYALFNTPLPWTLACSIYMGGSSSR